MTAPWALTVSLSGHQPHLIARHARNIALARMARYFSCHGRSKRWLGPIIGPRDVGIGRSSAVVSGDTALSKKRSKCYRDSDASK